ncbi:MAG: PDDEXK nuclease domain-containing protein [Alphaproteobacteria bacterium]|uniref:PDDEXK nuclease domain-containing protein n=1 Tax=Candidatus Nitrobium versatile TaxID=2884831 RepID=A0A953J6D0_9BACT|nr:PDDEXK nuclease domain-containing protein [Candidatus Nitrobium versatile]
MRRSLSLRKGKASKTGGIRQSIRYTVRSEFYESIAEVLRSARSNSYRAVNFVMVEAYWNVGRMIVEEEQKGKKRADYGDALVRSLSERLTLDFGKGFNMSNLWAFKQFYLAFPILRTLCGESSETRLSQRQVGNNDPAPSSPYAVRRELTWSHYRLLIRVEKQEARQWYMNEAAEQNWSVRALERQINSLYYERLKMSCAKETVIKEMQEKTALIPAKPQDFIKDPYVLEFLGMKDSPSFRESDLEQSIIGKLQAFMLELGKGFAFVARQQRISTETSDFFVDLVFYNYILKCFVLIDLKNGKLTHQDIGQMDMYVRLYEDKIKGTDDNPTIGIILCTEKDETVAKYSVLKENKRLFASKYKLYLPTEKELIEEIERERALIVSERRERYGV